MDGRGGRGDVGLAEFVASTIDRMQPLTDSEAAQVVALLKA